MRELKLTTQTDEEWSQDLVERKAEAERRMLIEDHKKGFVTLKEIQEAARAWRCDQHSAELRLMRGELPDA